MAAQKKGFWSMEMADPPKLTNTQWNLIGLLGVILIVAAILQAIGFNDFKGWFQSVGFNSGTAATVAVLMIIAELWAALSMFKLRLIPWFRTIGVYLAVLVAGFWFVENLRLISAQGAEEISSSGFFGKFLELSPGWWSVLGITAVLFWVIYSAGLLEKNLTVTGRRAR